MATSKARIGLVGLGYIGRYVYDQISTRPELGLEVAFVHESAAERPAGLPAADRIAAGESVVLMLTGAGLKDLDALKHQPFNVIESSLDKIRRDVEHAFK